MSVNAHPRQSAPGSLLAERRTVRGMSRYSRSGWSKAVRMPGSSISLTSADRRRRLPHRCQPLKKHTTVSTDRNPLGKPKAIAALSTAAAATRCRRTRLLTLVNRTLHLTPGRRIVAMSGPPDALIRRPGCAYPADGIGPSHKRGSAEALKFTSNEDARLAADQHVGEGRRQRLDGGVNETPFTLGLRLHRTGYSSRRTHADVLTSCQ